jgi:GT2 family glycosyltransferase
MEVSIIIPTYNRRDILKKCLECLLPQTYPADKFEVVIADDNSTDGTKEMVQSFRAPFKIKFVLQDISKRGAAANNNLGIKNASGKYLLFMNNDIFVTPDFISQHMKYHEKYPGVIVQGPAYNTSDLNNPLQETKGYSGYSNIQLGYFVTWNCSIEKELIVKAGMFDEAFRNISWEDIELGTRLRKLKIKQVFNPEAKAYHYRSPFSLADMEGIRKKSIAMGHNAVIYYRKHPRLDTMIATGSWFGMRWINHMRGSVAHIIGKNLIMGLYKWLLAHKWQRTLAVLVGWSGKYWYMKGVEEALRGPKH